MAYRSGGSPPATQKDFVINVHLQNPKDKGKTIPQRALVDTGAGPLFINYDKVQSWGFQILPYKSAPLYTVQRHRLNIMGQIDVEWYPKIGGELLRDTFLVTRGLSHDILLGTDRWHDVKGRLSDAVLADVREGEARGGTYDLVACGRNADTQLRAAGEWVLSPEHNKYYRNNPSRYGKEYEVESRKAFMLTLDRKHSRVRVVRSLYL